MKTTFKIIAAFILTASSLALSSCEKDEGKLPNIAFKTGAGYTSANATVAQGSTVLIGIDASKSEKKDVLKTFNISKSYDGGANTTVENTDLSGSNEDNYSRDYSIVTRSQAGTEKYTFTVTNRDGLTNQVTLTLTVQ
jgi:hypothetical protein